MKVTGGVKVERTKLDYYLSGAWKPTAYAILDKHAFAIEANAKVGAPVLTSALRNSIHTETPNQSLRIIADAVTYGVFQELGTSRGISAKFFLTKACENQADKFFDELRGIFK